MGPHWHAGTMVHKASPTALLKQHCPIPAPAQHGLTINQKPSLAEPTEGATRTDSDSLGHRHVTLAVPMTTRSGTAIHTQAN